MNDAEKMFKAAVESKFAGRKVIIGRNANLSVAQPHHIELGRGDCQNRSICERGCSFGAMYSQPCRRASCREKNRQSDIGH